MTRTGLLGVMQAVALSLAMLPSFAQTKTIETKPSDRAATSPTWQTATLDKDFKTFDGAFVILDVDNGKYFRYHPDRCKERVSPCSTFKIFNSLVGLETGALTGKDHFMKWDGTKHKLETWNHDQTLQSAIKDSVVWYFQKVAELVGEQNMTKYINSVHYGNEDLSAGLTQFWLGKSLTISPDEQVEFLKNLYQEKLPFSKKNIDTVKEILVVSSGPGGTLCGKTGTDSKNGKITMGWFVGWVVHDGHPYIFATNIKGKDNAYGRKAREITKTLLQQAKLFTAQQAPG